MLNGEELDPISFNTDELPACIKLPFIVRSPAIVTSSETVPPGMMLINKGDYD